MKIESMSAQCQDVGLQMLREGLGLETRTVRVLQFRLYVQACRGNWTDPGVTVMAKDSLLTSGDMVDSLSQKPQHFQIPSMADLLVMYSTYEGTPC